MPVSVGISSCHQRLCIVVLSLCCFLDIMSRLNEWPRPNGADVFERHLSLGVYGPSSVNRPLYLEALRVTFEIAEVLCRSEGNASFPRLLIIDCVTR